MKRLPVRRLLPGLVSAFVLIVLSGILVVEPVLPQGGTAPTGVAAPTVNVSCAIGADANAVFTITANADQATTVQGTYSIDPGGPSGQPFSVATPGSLDVTGPARLNPHGEG